MHKVCIAIFNYKCLVIFLVLPFAYRTSYLVCFHYFGSLYYCLKVNKIKYKIRGTQQT